MGSLRVIAWRLLALGHFLSLAGALAGCVPLGSLDERSDGQVTLDARFPEDARRPVDAAGAIDAARGIDARPGRDTGDDAPAPTMDDTGDPPMDAVAPPADVFAGVDALDADSALPDAVVPGPDALPRPDGGTDAAAPVDSGPPVPCALPANACADGSESRDRCGGARAIGRRSASDPAGYSVTADTCSASNRFDDCSWDQGNDHAYRIWLRAGERVSARITGRAASCFASPGITLKLYESTGCTDLTCGTDQWCHDFVSNGESFMHTATRDGWIVIVVDGPTAFDEEGRYTLNVALTGCATTGCEC